MPSALRQPIDRSDPGVQAAETVDQALNAELGVLRQFELGQRTSSLAPWLDHRPNLDTSGAAERTSPISRAMAVAV